MTIKNLKITNQEELTNVLSNSPVIDKSASSVLTGYPSNDKPWLKYYRNDAEELVNNIPLNKTVWDVIEEKLLEYYDIPALEYFGKVFSRQEFIDLCYVWARTFRAMGVEENEVVPIYGPFVPDICAMVFGLNMIGACPYFLKLAINKESLASETKDSKIAVVYDGMWQNVASEFSKDKFKNIIVATATADMPSPKKQIVSFLNLIQSMKNKSQIPNEKKYIWIDKAKEIANYYSGNVKVPFVPNRSTIITSSSGTTNGGLAKGVVATNESILTQVYSTTYSDILYRPGLRTLNHFPPAAATSLNALFLVGLFNGATIIVDPRVSEKDFYNQLVFLKPNICINTGSLWETFFNRISEEIKQGKKFDFSYAKGWMIGGEGTTSKKMEQWDKIMEQCGGGYIYGGYGLSETFSGISYDRVDEKPNFSKLMINSGLIQAGMVAGVFDKDGNELSYNQRGELKVKTNASMKEYYHKPELTAQTVVDGWVKTGDLAEIDENGFLYIWGRIVDNIVTSNGEKIYLFDIENIIKENEFVDDAIVLTMPSDENDNNLVVHIVWRDNPSLNDKKTNIELMNKQLNNCLPNDVKISAYCEHETMLPYSPTTLKKDKNKMSQQTTNYVQVIDGKLNEVEFILNENGKYSQKCAIMDKNRVKVLKRK